MKKLMSIKNWREISTAKNRAGKITKRGFHNGAGEGCSGANTKGLLEKRPVAL
jgi:hypothetical protein